MIYSMTGFGKATASLPNFKVSIELRSLNSKNLDFVFKAPPAMRDKEADVRQRIGKRLERGKIDCWIHLELSSSGHGQRINKELVGIYLTQLQELGKLHQIQSNDFLAIAMRMPDVVESVEESLSEEQWNAVSEALDEAMDALMNHRRAEGKVLENIFLELVNTISSKLNGITSLEQERKQRTRVRLLKALNELGLETPVDQNRFEQELIYYLEKLDITEEKVRLANHCSYFLETMASEEASGKKLNFIAQEMGREINTLGAKANEANIQRVVVEMKDDLEKIKEQVLNTL